ncbi:histone H1 [Pochonia chlamydosporia 170]|uniref:Histone H1 n=1 Tax=Pochonia chlamydosporia 170 TaxID=1380566 RepID=A0A179FKL0_METCM|nr:histone H1 [Pochonia chlamydosporia 170]OAQ66165.1 histone H1 [Pochonia chlamydosporia 170]
MPPKKAEGSAAPKAKSTHASYQDMITDAIVNLKDRNGSSRQSLKKYVKANNNLGTVSDNMFDSLFNKALKTGVEKGVFAQPKGPSGGTKLAKKKAEPKKPAAKKEGVKKAATTKKAAPKKAAAPKAAGEKKAATTTKKAAPKKATTTAKKPAAKADKDSALTKTKTGRVAKTTKPAAKKAAAPKKAAPKKAAAKA